MAIYSETTESRLNNLLEKSYDAEKGFKKAAEKVQSPMLESFFNKKANERTNFINELRGELNNNGCDVKEDGGSVTGSLHRSWMDVKTLFTSDNEEAVLEEVQKGEKAALNDYNDILKDNQLPPTTSNILTRQRNVIKSSYDKADYLEEIQ